MDVLMYKICISVVNRGQPTPNHVITRPLLLTHHHTNSSPAHLVLSTASSKVCKYPHSIYSNFFNICIFVGSDNSKSAITTTVKWPSYSQAECDGGYE